jgi:DNA helicase II / ATP-dependent DNA helicase PcrA
MAKPAAKPKKKPAKPLAAPKASAKRSAPVEAPRFAPRARVTHQMFGPGIVQSVDGDKLEIKFAKVGLKWIVTSYVTPD